MNTTKDEFTKVNKDLRDLGKWCFITGSVFVALKLVGLSASWLWLIIPGSIVGGLVILYYVLLGMIIDTSIRNSIIDLDEEVK